MGRCLRSGLDFRFLICLYCLGHEGIFWDMAVLGGRGRLFVNVFRSIALIVDAIETGNFIVLAFLGVTKRLSYQCHVFFFSGLNLAIDIVALHKRNS